MVGTVDDAPKFDFSVEFLSSSGVPTGALWTCQ